MQNYIAGLFEDEDIVHARETIHYLISKQGDKATHFQVIVPLFKLLKNHWRNLSVEIHGRWREGKTRSLSFKPEFGTCWTRVACLRRWSNTQPTSLLSGKSWATICSWGRSPPTPFSQGGRVRSRTLTTHTGTTTTRITGHFPQNTKVQQNIIQWCSSIGLLEWASYCEILC